MGDVHWMVCFLVYPPFPYRNEAANLLSPGAADRDHVWSDGLSNLEMAARDGEVRFRCRCGVR